MREPGDCPPPIEADGFASAESADEAGILEVSLLQNGLALARGQRSQPLAAASATAETLEPAKARQAQEGVSEDEGVAFLQSDFVLSTAASARASVKTGAPFSAGARYGYDCLGGMTTLPLLTGLEVLRSTGYFKGRPGCMDEAHDVDSVLRGELLAASPGPELLTVTHADVVGLAQPKILEWSQRIQERLVLGGYFGLYAVSVAFVCYGLHKPWRTSEKKIQFQGCRRVKTEIDVEEETWQRSGIAWLCCSWASPWIGRWGSGASTKINPDDLPQMGGREYQARECAKLFGKLWREEVQTHGLAGASVFRVVVRMWTVRSMLTLMVILGCQMMLHNLYTVVLIEHSMNYFVWLQKQRYEHPEQSVPMAGPMLTVILVFSAMPFLNALLSTLSQHIARRLDQRVTGALCVAIFEKAQRLPLSYLQQAMDRKASQSDSGEKAEEGDAEAEAPTVDMMQLIGYDIYQSLQGSYFQVCSCGNSFVACVVFAVMLWMRLGKATLAALGVAVSVLFILVVFCLGLASSYDSLAKVVDQRVQAVREMLTGVRIVKCYAWEEAMEGKVKALRGRELDILDAFWRCLGGIIGVALVFPRALVIAALGAFSVMYGTHSVSNILVCMQILYGLKASCEVLGVSMGRSITIGPSLQRIESFLKLPEAPVLLPDKVPPWLQLWSSANDDNHVRLEGSFAWKEGGLAVLHDLDVEILHGELVGIVGRVGSGKSTILQAILGELYPVEDSLSEPALLSRPQVIAYCPQVAHIAESSLMDNVLFGQEFDQLRYNEALAAASLEADLKVLPGGDLVPIGSRGITLSGGQKARVALARAAYHRGSEVVLMDDPFGSVDAPTAAVLLDKLLLGPLMQGRTRIVSLQPDDERLRKFDRVIILEDGRIKEQGSPQHVLRSEAYRQILSSRAGATEHTSDAPELRSPANSVERIKEDNRAVKIKLREEEYEHRPTWHMIRQYCQIGRYRNIINTLLLYCLQAILYMYCDLVLANWTNAIALNPQGVKDSSYVCAYLFWLGVGAAIWPVLWACGMRFTLGISKEILELMLSRVLSAPIDKFFDKHPIGRIMNRVVTDVAAVDFQLFMKATSTITVTIHTIIPVVYVHFIVPWFFTILALPLYALIATLCMRYWNTTVPFRYCAANARSDVNNIIGEVASSNAVIRAYGDQERITLDMCDAVDNELKADLNGQRVLKRWLINRVVMLWSFYTTSTLIVGFLNTDRIGAGTLGLCLSMLFVVEALIEPNLENATGAQMELISLARIHEYLSIPQEATRWRKDDTKYRSFVVRLPRRGCGALRCRVGGSGLEVFKGHKVLLRATPCGTALVAGSSDVQELCPECKELSMADRWHRVVAVGSVAHDATGMANELCHGSIEFITIELRSGWLAEGARVEIDNLTAGYADVPRDVLKGINLLVEPRSKVGIVGTTGCGKSTLLLVLLRIIEPRSGRVLINGVDTSALGLGTLRRALGLVPQDPVLFSGTLRQNLDPLGHYSDSRVMAAVKLAQVGNLVETWSDGLDHAIIDEGANLSFGQRQLLCLARMILRQPALLLLDEATSAIDPKTQDVVQETINCAFSNSTLIAVAHRLETILDFDCVCVLERGEVVEKGEPKEVARRPGGHFNRMLAARKVHQ